MIVNYDRAAAVAYANRWWNGHNPAFTYFPSDDCTNYISQVLLAGGFPMEYTGVRDRGWWYRGGANPDWSFSWAVAHSLRWYLAQHPAVEAHDSPQRLELGDIINIDFEGDGVVDHSLVVTGFSATGDPLVNAHTSSSLRRHWSYRDSPAWTPNIQYFFWHIRDR